MVWRRRRLPDGSSVEHQLSADGTEEQTRHLDRRGRETLFESYRHERHQASPSGRPQDDLPDLLQDGDLTDLLRDRTERLPIYRRETERHDGLTTIREERHADLADGSHVDETTEETSHGDGHQHREQWNRHTDDRNTVDTVQRDGRDVERHEVDIRHRSNGDVYIREERSYEDSRSRRDRLEDRGGRPLGETTEKVAPDGSVSRALLEPDASGQLHVVETYSRDRYGVEEVQRLGDDGQWHRVEEDGRDHGASQKLSVSPVAAAEGFGTPQSALGDGDRREHANSPADHHHVNAAGWEHAKSPVGDDYQEHAKSPADEHQHVDAAGWEHAKSPADEHQHVDAVGWEHAKSVADGDPDDHAQSPADTHHYVDADGWEHPKSVADGDPDDHAQSPADIHHHVDADGWEHPKSVADGDPDDHAKSPADSHHHVDVVDDGD